VPHLLDISNQPHSFPQESFLKNKATVEEVLSHIPGPITAEWPLGEPFAVALSHGTMSVEYYSPLGHDPQTPHEQDEIYFIHRGAGELVMESLIK
jgi:hypothetical protein